ncbi:hypothetical protein Bca101_043396 [Brassica carinata]
MTRSLRSLRFAINASKEKEDIFPFALSVKRKFTVSHASRNDIKEEARDHERFHHLQYLIGSMLPFLKKLCKAHMEEIETEAKIQGLMTSQVDISETLYSNEERVFCNHCIRGGSFSERPEMKLDFVYRGSRYIHGEDAEPTSSSVLEDEADDNKPPIKWTADENGSSITCASKELGGCGDCVLELKRILPLTWMSDLEKRAETFIASRSINSLTTSNCRCVSDPETSMTRKAASRTAPETITSTLLILSTS